MEKMCCLQRFENKICFPVRDGIIQICVFSVCGHVPLHGVYILFIARQKRNKEITAAQNRLGENHSGVFPEGKAVSKYVCHSGSARSPLPFSQAQS